MRVGIKLGNWYRRTFWYPVMRLLGKLGLMDTCAYCGATHHGPLYEWVTLYDGSQVQVCNYCMDMSHEEWFYPTLNDKVGIVEGSKFYRQRSFPWALVEHINFDLLLLS